MKNISNLSFNGIELKPLKGRIKNGEDVIKKLTRPYTVIPREFYDEIISQKIKTDFYIYGDKVITFGSADSGFALMPFQDEYAKMILDNHKKLLLKTKKGREEQKKIEQKKNRDYGLSL